MKFFSATLLILLSVSISSSCLAQNVADEEDFFNEDLEDLDTSSSIADPFEKINRGIFAFNDFVYIKVFKPVSKTYQMIMPNPVEKGIGNVFDNIKYPVRLTSNLLQFRVGQAAKETGSFLIDSTVGIAGVIDVSGTIPDLATSKEDIGQAFGSWGIGNGFYFVMPFFGPTTLRDFVGGRADNFVAPLNEPWSPIESWELRTGASVVKAVNESGDLVSLYERVKDASIDPYEAFKDGYIQTRKAQIQE